MQGCESRRGIWATDLISKMTEATDVPISQWNENVPVASQSLPCVSQIVDPEGVAHGASRSNHLVGFSLVLFCFVEWGLPM